MSGSKYIQIGPNGDRYAEYVVLMDPATGLPVAGGGGGSAPLDPRLDALTEIEQWTENTQDTLADIYLNFGALIDQSLKLEELRSDVDEILNHLKNSVSTVTRTALACVNYNLSYQGSFNIPANPLRKSLRVINASGDGATYPVTNQADLLVAVNVVPDALTFDRHIPPMQSELMDFPTLSHYVGAIGLGSLDGHFIIVEGF